jgi:prevent-host-death family protein
MGCEAGPMGSRLWGPCLPSLGCGHWPSSGPAHQGRLFAKARCTTIMYMNVLPIAEARRRLPELVRKVAAGHPPIAIGRRGAVEALIVPAGTAMPVPRRPLRGLIKILGDLEAGSAEITELFEEGLRRSATLLANSHKKQRTVRRKRAR